MNHVLLLACVIAAVVLDLGPFHRLHDADSLLPVLMSLTRWTPFLWEQNRFGMPIALLAMPIRDVFANLLFQNAVCIGLGLVGVVLLVRFAWPEQGSELVGLVAAAALLLAAPAPFTFAYLSTYAPYGPSFGLGIAGLLVAVPASRCRLGAGLALLALASWVNSAVGLILLPLALLVPSPGRRTRVLVVCVGTVLGLALMRLGPDETRLDQVPPADWPEAWRQLAATGAATLTGGTWLATLVLCMGVGLGALTRGPVRCRAPGAFLPAGVLLAIALAYVLSLGTSEWVRANAFAMRYLVLPLILIHVAVVLATLGPALAVLGPRARPEYGAAALIAAVLLAYGPPSRASARAALDQKIGARTADVLAANCTHLAGSYFPVWETTFHTMLVRRERAEYEPIFALTYRSRPTRDLWSSLPFERWRLCVAVGDEAQANVWLNNYAIPWGRTVERRGRIVVRSTGTLAR